jgi:hypothetical protein
VSGNIRYLQLQMECGAAADLLLAAPQREMEDASPG